MSSPGRVVQNGQVAFGLQSSEEESARTDSVCAHKDPGVQSHDEVEHPEPFDSQHRLNASWLILENPWPNRWTLQKWTGGMCKRKERETGLRNLRRELQGEMDMGC